MLPTNEQLKQFIEETGQTATAVARALGIAPSTLSQYLSGSYRGSVERIDADVQSFLARQAEKETQPRRRVSFVDTTPARKVFEVARICHMEGCIGVVYGDAGLGKTTAVKEYTAQNSGVILIEADLGYTAKVLFEELHRALGMDGRGTIHAMMTDVLAKLRGSERLIIVDEAEHLPYRALELLRRVHDKADVGILLTGMPRLISNLRGKRGEYAQLYSRVTVAGRLEALKLSDTEKVVKALIPDAGKRLIKAYHEHSYANARVLARNLLPMSIRVAEINGMAVDADVVAETAKMLIV